MKEVENNQKGEIISYFSGIAKVTDLHSVGLYELLVDEKGARVGIVIGFDEKYAEVLIFDEDFDPQKNVFRSFKQFSVPVSDSHLGRIIDGLGRPVDNMGPVLGEERNIFSEAPAIIDRDTVSTPISTGIKIIDTSLPLGRGQRELIIGDRKLGKSVIAQDIILNQKKASPVVYCIYVLCGQKEDKLKQVINLFDEHNAFLYTTVVATPAFSSFAQTFLAPFVGLAIGEYFMQKGLDVLIVYDDLSQHAKSYRDIALLLQRSPGRETYPGDIFSLHASLLERAGKLSKEKGGGSLTALPIVETQEGDVTGFIPTNIISITDGQIYFENGLYQKGFLPSINVGLSVSRVGSRAQHPVLKKVTGGLRLILSQYKELQKLIQLETTLSKEAQGKIHRGELLLELLKQGKHTNITTPGQVILFFSVEEGFFDDLKINNWQSFEKLLLEFLNSRYLRFLEKIEQGGWDEHMKLEVKNIIMEFKEEFKF